MRNKGTSILFAVIFSVLFIVYLNSLSIAREDEKIEVKIESEVYNQLEKQEKVNIIVNLKKNFDSEDINKIVKYSKNNIDSISKELSEKGQKINLIYEYEALNAVSIQADKETIELLKNSPFVDEIFAERFLQIESMDSMPLINATNAWNVQVTTGTQTTNLTGAGQVVCLIDTGVDYNHTALGGGWGNKIIGGYDFVNSDPDPMDDNGHGTHLAGIIAGKGMVGTFFMRGVAPDASIIAQKVCDSTGSCSNIKMLGGLNDCLTTINPKKLSVISMSIGDGQSYSNVSGTCPTWMDSGINLAVSYGLPVIVSSGNQGYKNGISYPACSPNATSVGATYDKTTASNTSWGICTETTVVDKVACASNTGNNLHLVAPGATITSTATPHGLPGACGYINANNTLSSCKGTSQAAAHAAGSVALFRQKFGTTRIKRNYTGVAIINKFLRASPISTIDSANGLSFPRLSLLRVL